MKIPFASTVFILLVTSVGVCAAENNRAQYPPWLTNSYIGFGVGRIDYPFSQAQLEPGFRAESVNIPHLAVSAILLGHQFNRNLSAQMSYMRPVLWVNYRNINGDPSKHTVGMNIAGLTARATAPFGKRFSIYGEGGLGIITRGGLKLKGQDVIKDANYPTILLGAGFQYHLNNTWDLQTGVAYTMPNESQKQPYTILVSSGIVFNLRPLPNEKVQEAFRSEAIFSQNLVQLGYTTNTFGTGVNRFVSGKARIFWGGNVDVMRGITLRYQRNVFHTKSIFSLDWGASIAGWRSARDRTDFYTISMFPQFRFTLLRLKPVDLYLIYSLAGPTYITKTTIDGRNTGRHFTFQDSMGLGWYIGKQRNLNMEISIGHYSNGNIFPNNTGIKIPLTFMLGYTFKR